VNKHFPCDVHCAPELFVSNSERTGVPPKPVDSHGTREEYVRRRNRDEFGRELLQLSAHVLTRGVLGIKGGRCWLGKQGCKEVVDALGVEESRKLGEDFGCGDAQRNDGDRDGLAT